MSKPTVLLAFLGTGNYQRCQYRIGSQTSAEVQFFSAALTSELKPDLLLTLETTGATDRHGESLGKELLTLFPGVNHQAIRIPEGGSESQLWEIFTCLTSHVPAGSKLHLDITHGFRSLPVLGFIALSYLRVTRRVEIGGIYYGAWEARDQGTNIAPVFDLTPFLTLLDWTTAADQFFTTGSAARLATLLSEAQQALWRNRGNKRVTELPHTLKSLGNQMEEASSSLLLLRTGNFLDVSKRLSDTLAQARKEADAHAKPFLELIEPVEHQLTHFRDTDLATLRDLVGWLSERGQTSAALTLASEWLTSWVMVTLGKPDHHTSESDRGPYQQCLSLLMARKSLPDTEAPSRHCEELLTHLRNTADGSTLDTLVSLASQIQQARNDVNHAGFREHPHTADSLVKLAQIVASKLSELTLPALCPPA